MKRVFLIFLLINIIWEVNYSQIPVKRKSKEKTEQSQSSAAKRRAESGTKRQQGPGSQKELIGTLNGHDWVDLGLPSGTRWATCNVGASAIQDCGYYLSWGGQFIPKDENYSRENAPLFGENIADISGNINYDAARSKWGAEWRMPTKAEFIELTKYCHSKISMVNGVKGSVITGPNGNSIFIPYNGVKSGSLKSFGASDATLWLSTQSDTDMAYLFVCGDDGFKTTMCNNKNVGYPIRPVLSK